MTALLGAGFPVKEVSAERWARSVCTSLTDWTDALADAQDEHDLDATDPEESKEAVVAYLEQVTDDTDALLDGLEKAGTPDVEDGKAIARTFRKGFKQARETFADAAQDAEALDTDDREQYVEDVREISEAINEGGAEIGETFDEADRKYDVPELDEAFDAEPACSGI